MRTYYALKLGTGGFAYADVTHEPGDRHATLQYITCPSAWRRRGLGTRLLKQICEAADREGVELRLCVLPAVNISSTQLGVWYAKHGFSYTSASNRVLMRRRPKALQQGIIGVEARECAGVP